MMISLCKNICISAAVRPSDLTFCGWNGRIECYLMIARDLGIRSGFFRVKSWQISRCQVLNNMKSCWLCIFKKCTFVTVCVHYILSANDVGSFQFSLSTTEISLSNYVYSQREWHEYKYHIIKFSSTYIK